MNEIISRAANSAQREYDAGGTWEEVAHAVLMAVRVPENMAINEEQRATAKVFNIVLNAILAQ